MRNSPTHSALLLLLIAASPNLAAAMEIIHPKIICTNQPPSQWKPAAEMRKIAEARGYKISTFKISNDSCYEVYGFKDNTVVEAYFDPVTAALVKQNVAK